MKNQKQHNIKQKFQINRGIYKGFTLFLESNETTRPTKALVKKSFFDTLQHDIKDKIFIECFAGSGQMGFEALSVGAKKVVFFEQDKKAFSNLQHNIILFQEKIHSLENIQCNNTRDSMIARNSMIECYCMDFFTSQKLLESYAKHFKNNDLGNKKADSKTKNAIMTNLILPEVQQHNGIILYFDPPFSCRNGFDDIYTKIVHFIESFSKSLLQQVDIIIIEKMSDVKLDEKLSFFSLHKTKTFGKTSLAYFNKIEE